MPDNLPERTDLVAVPDDVGPNERNVSFAFFECRECQERSETARCNERGNLTISWDADHMKATKHRKFYLFTITRQTATVH